MSGASAGPISALVLLLLTLVRGALGDGDASSSTGVANAWPVSLTLMSPGCVVVGERVQALNGICYTYEDGQQSFLITCDAESDDSAWTFARFNGEGCEPPPLYPGSLSGNSTACYTDGSSFHRIRCRIPPPVPVTLAPWPTQVTTYSTEDCTGDPLSAHEAINGVCRLDETYASGGPLYIFSDRVSCDEATSASNWTYTSYGDQECAEEAHVYSGSGSACAGVEGTPFFSVRVNCSFIGSSTGAAAAGEPSSSTGAAHPFNLSSSSSSSSGVDGEEEPADSYSSSSSSTGGAHHHHSGAPLTGVSPFVVPLCLFALLVTTCRR